MTKAKLDIIITHCDEHWDDGRKLFDSLYIQECCDYNDVNIILVQDGAGTALDWDYWLSEYPYKVNIITLQEPSGVSAARNAGIENAVSDWIMFMDFDDMLADAATLSQILALFPVTEDVDIIWSKYVREISGHGRAQKTSMNCERNPDFRLIGKMYRRDFLNEHNIRFLPECEEACDVIFNNIALSETYDHRFMEFQAPFYPFLKRLRKDGAFSTLATIHRKVDGITNRDIILVNEMKRRGKTYKFGIWVARTILDAYHRITPAELEPLPDYGITDQLIAFWKEHEDAYMQVSQNDIDVALDASQEEAMTYIQSYYNDHGEKEYYLQNDMATIGDFTARLDELAFPATATAPKPAPATSRKNDRVVVYCGTRETYINMIASVKSLLATTHVDKVFFLIEDDKFPYDLPDIIETRNVGNTGMFNPDGPNFTNPWTYMCLMRTAYHNMFPEYSKVLSLDIDVVITEDIGNLWDIDLSDYYFAGVAEQGRTENTENEFYANFGVIMLNLDKLRADGIGDKIFNAVNNEHFSCPEQDAFNKYCKGHMYRLPNDYNVTVYSHITGEPLKERILHYAGLRYWKHFGPVKKYYNLSWDEIMNLQRSVRNG